MDVLEVVVRFPPFVGGVESTVYELGRRLVRRGHAVRVVCAAEPPGAPAEIDGMPVRRLPYVAKVGNTNLALGLGRALRQVPADLVHTHMPTAWFADAAAAAARRRRLPLVVTYNNDLTGRGAKGLLARVYNRLLLPRVLRQADRVVVPNPLYAERSPHLRPFRGKVISIPWGSDLERFRPRPLPTSPPLRLSFLSILDAHHGYKGLDVLLRALAGASSRRVELEVGGAGELVAAYQRLAADLGVAGRVRFHGFVPDAELPRFYAGSHLFVLPSIDATQEGFGLVLVEAMACGRPVLTTTEVGMADAISEAAAGVVVAPGDAAALAAVIDRLATDRGELERLAGRARSLVEARFGWEGVTGSYEGLFASLAGGRSSSNQTSLAGSIQHRKRS